jgi:hypothetical protein
MFARTHKIWVVDVDTYPENMGELCLHVPIKSGNVMLTRTQKIWECEVVCERVCDVDTFPENMEVCGVYIYQSSPNIAHNDIGVNRNPMTMICQFL